MPVWSMRSQAAGCCNTDSSSFRRTTLAKLCMVQSETMTPARDEYAHSVGRVEMVTYS